jgi:precorrin-3B methylase
MKRKEYIQQFEELMAMDDNELRIYNRNKDARMGPIKNFKMCFPEKTSYVLINLHKTVREKKRKEELSNLKDLMRDRKLQYKTVLKIIS